MGSAGETSMRFLTRSGPTWIGWNTAFKPAIFISLPFLNNFVNFAGISENMEKDFLNFRQIPEKNSCNFMYYMLHCKGKTTVTIVSSAEKAQQAPLLSLGAGRGLAP
jgi:hypothetical protein